MRWNRITVVGLMVIVFYSALASMALRYPTPFGASLLCSVTILILFTAVLLAIYGVGPERDFWVGVSVFGWGYLLLAFWLFADPIVGVPSLGPHLLLTDVAFRLGIDGSVGIAGKGVQPTNSPRSWNSYDTRAADFVHIGHSLFVLVFALVGGALASVLAGRTRQLRGAATTRSTGTQSEDPRTPQERQSG